jgi:hypothetical protein
MDRHEFATAFHRWALSPFSLQVELFATTDGERVVFSRASELFPEVRTQYFLDQIHLNARGNELFGNLRQGIWPPLQARLAAVSPKFKRAKIL